MNKLTKRHFWEWFKQNNKAYLDLPNKRKKEVAYWINELSAHLRAYGRFLSFNLTVTDQQTASLTITVNGRVSLFKKADALVALAPEIPGWTIASLEAPMSINDELEEQLSATGITMDDLYFSFASDDPDDNDIRVYHLLCNEDSEHTFYNIAHAAIYNLLGERSFGLDIGCLEVANLSEVNGARVWKLEELPSRINARWSSCVVNEAGVLEVVAAHG